MFKKSIRRRRIGTNNGMVVGGLSRERRDLFVSPLVTSLLRPETCSGEPLPQPLHAVQGSKIIGENDWTQVGRVVIEGRLLAYVRQFQPWQLLTLLT